LPWLRGAPLVTDTTILSLPGYIAGGVVRYKTIVGMGTPRNLQWHLEDLDPHLREWSGFRIVVGAV
jgi:hypothetical protein